jgi:hypothetical protein
MEGASSGKLRPHMQDWGQVCRFQGKNGGGFGAFTTRIRTQMGHFVGRSPSRLSRSILARKML